ncbi:MAG: hypothetical protein QM796_15585 [Chthoniobacteraceae bacterium]
MKLSGLPILSSLLLLAACNRSVTNANLHEVQPDMSTKEVESILGQPVKVQQDVALKTEETVSLPVTKYVYEQNGRTVTLTFVEDHLAEDGIDGTFQPEAKPEPKKQPSK